MQRYRAGVSPVDLQWTMRLKNFGTLEHYLQELAAVTALTEVSPSGRSRIHTAATLSCSPTTLLVPLVFLAKILFSWRLLLQDLRTLTVSTVTADARQPLPSAPVPAWQ